RAIAPQIEVRLEPRSASRDRAATAIVSSAMRMGIRDYKRALTERNVVTTGASREVWALRTTGWLTDSQLREVVELIKRLVNDVSRPKDEGRLFGLTLAFAPVHQRGRARIRPE
ncbi:MAG TPA: hypothetical protein VEV38_13975, partial [Candidatus Eremiobacteraceae bacterium]|nr:hypothetical protein [Candidatus Eremiobacteraceae bacterium]